MSTVSALPEPVRRWLRHLETNRRYSRHTLQAYEHDLAHLIALNPDITVDNLHEDHIRRTIARLRSQGHQPRSLARALAAWRGFYQWWGPQAGLNENPTKGIRAPKAARQLPKALSVEQTQALLDRPGLPPPNSNIELRDQAMFEVLYSSGLRLAELVSLDWRYHHSPQHTSASWVDLPNAQATIAGKGGKTRQVPLGRHAIQAVQKWLVVRRDLLASQPSADTEAALFLGERGKRISPRVVQIQLNKLVQQLGLPINVHPHSLRHSFASHMLQSAQDLRAVQELLGHANISTTQIYTRLDFQHLANAYDKAHPRATRKSK
tara:strand:- start:1131 stop:2093 length:963 start_codon:yes stop_codon:yes gene_type:complete